MVNALPFVGFGLAISGGWLLDSAARNRPPLGTIAALVKDPSNLVDTINRLNGTWQDMGVDAPVSAKKYAQTAKANNDNGRLTDADLVGLGWAPGKRLLPSAASALTSLNNAYRARFGRNLTVTDAYRSYSQQVAVKAKKGKLAATPGTSNHGLGIAVDLGGGIQSFGTPEHVWMQENAPKYGWRQPSWAVKGGSKPEPWHWEFGTTG